MAGETALSNLQHTLKGSMESEFMSYPADRSKGSFETKDATWTQLRISDIKLSII